MRAKNLYSALILSFLITVSGHANDENNNKKKPLNIIFFLADDMRWDAMRCAGNKIIKTPNLDNLANSGVMFSNAFVTTSICAISRASILTGQYASKHGINDFRTSLSSNALSKTYPILMRNAGYHTGFIGKYGIGHTVEGVAKEFDYFWGTARQPDFENIDEDGNFIHYTDRIKKTYCTIFRGTGKKQAILFVCQF